MHGIYLLLGSNMGERLEQLKKAEHSLIQAGIQVLEESSVYETEPWGKSDQGWFLNVLLQVETPLSPEQLLAETQRIETQLGRVRDEKWGARTIDIDILYYHQQTVNTKDLSIPHPGIVNRKFTLLPLVEVCPLEVHPTAGKNQVELLAACTDSLACLQTDWKL